MGDFKVKCVRVFGSPETKKLLEDAYKCLKEDNLSPVWFSEEECFSVKEKEKNSVYIFDVFEGDAFEHIASLNCRILGPLCILTSLACKKNIPRRSGPVYNLAMKDIVVCCTNLDPEKRNELHLKVERMGGQTSKNFTEDVTHLVAGSVGSQKYQVAAGCGKQIMTPAWVDTVWEKSKLNAVHGLDEEFHEYKCPIFLGRVITVSGLGSKERKEAQKLIEKEGGTYSGEMKVKECTHLIINEPKGQKYMFAKKWQIYIVRSEWLYDSIEKGYCQDEVDYTTQSSQEDNKGQMKTSTPERLSTAGGMSDISNISMISMVNVNETVAPNITNMTVNSTHLLEQGPIEGLDLAKEPRDLFLDSTKIYLSGFRGVALEKLRKVINSGGGTRFNKISENLTHIILGERIPSDIEQIKSLHNRPHIVTSQWLVDSFKQEMMVEESPYSISDLVPCGSITPENKRTTRKSVTKKDVMQPSNSRQSDVAQHVREDEDDIMSQYMTGPPQDTGAPHCSNDTTVAPAAAVEEDDYTQEPDQTTVEDLGQGIFGGKTFVFYGFEDEHIPELTMFVTEKGGQVLKTNARRIPDFAVVPVDGFPVDKTSKDIVTNTWLQMCIEQDTLLDVHTNRLFTPIEILVDKLPLKECVLSISGYAGTERDCLMHIAEVLGARTQDYFVRRAKNGLLPSSHLIVNIPEGSKYEAAKKWNIPALSKLWILDCAKSGKREPEDKYFIENTVSSDYVTINEDKTENNSGHQNTSTKSVQNSSANNLDKSKSGEQNQACSDAEQASVQMKDCNNSAHSDKNHSIHEENQTGTKNNLCHNTGESISDLHDSVSAKNLQSSERTNVGLGVSANQDFSATGDTEALLAQMDTQGEVVNKEEADEQVLAEADDVVGVEAEAAPRVNVIEKVTHTEEKDRHEVSSKSVIQSLQREVQQSDMPPLMRLLKKIEEKHQDQTGSPAVTSMSVRDKLLAKTPIRHTLRLEPRKVVTMETHHSQKENVATVVTPVQSRVKELKKQEGKADKDTPSKFLNPNVRYHPRFDTEELMKEFETPEDVRAAKAKRRESLPLDELYDKMLEKASRTVLLAKEKQLDSKCSTVLKGVVIIVAKKLGKDQTELNEIAVSLGGDYRWSSDSSCTHFIFQGRQNDTAKDFKMAKSQGLLIVSPHWLHMCKEQNARVDESLLPHTYNPNLQLSLSTKRTPMRTPRSTRRNVSDRPTSTADESQQTPLLSRLEKAASADKGDNDIQGSKGGNLKASRKAVKSPVRTSPRNPNSVDDHKKAPASTEEAELETGGSLEMREVLSRQLENVMAEAKGKKRRRSKRLNCSDQIGTPEEVTSSGSKHRTQEIQQRNSLSSKNLSEEKPNQKNSADIAPSQSVHVVWDDPMGRMEQEKLAHKLQRVESPTQEVAGMYEEPEDAQYSETDDEAEPPVFTEQAMGEDKTTPKAVKSTSDKTPTPEGPSIAFPTANKVQEITPPKPVVIEESQDRQKPPPVFMLSGMSQAEKDDYGALIEQLGGIVLDTQEFDPCCTHLIISNITRNEKFLASIASGNWVLHKSYFEACREQKCFVEEDFYEWGSEGTLSLVKNLDSNVRLLAAAARDWRMKLSGAKQLQNSDGRVGAFCTWKVLLFCGAGRERNYKRLLEAGGASVVIDRPPFSASANATHAIVDPQKVNMTKADIEVLLGRGCCCLKPEYILAYLTDSNATTEQFCPEEIKAIKNTSQATDASAKKRKASGSDLSLKRSKRR